MEFVFICMQKYNKIYLVLTIELTVNIFSSAIAFILNYSTLVDDLNYIGLVA